MRFFNGVALLFYVLIISFGAGITLLFVTHGLLWTDVIGFLRVAYEDINVRSIVGGVAAAIIFLSFVFARLISGGRQKERTIAFDNPSGRVLVSLGAVEDLVKRILYRLPEIKETKLHIVKNKKGIEADTRIVLKTEVSIPEMTGRLQELVKSKIEEVLGIEEPVVVRVHVVKIVSDEHKAKRPKEEPEEKVDSTTVPFHGYRR